MDKEHQRKAKQHLAVLMEQGTPWKEAAESAGLHISRSTAYRWLAAWRAQREAAFQDGRHGHPAKLREAAWTFFEEMVKAAPETPSREVQAALSQQFGLTVSIGYLNQVRSHLGLGSRAARRGKNRSRCLPTRLAQNSTGLSPCCYLPQRSKRAWSPC